MRSDLCGTSTVYNEFVSYLNKGQLTSYSVRGYTVECLISDYKLDPLGAFLMLAELSKYPERGEKYLKMILEEGHETVVVDEDGGTRRSSSHLWSHLHGVMMGCIAVRNAAGSSSGLSNTSAGTVTTVNNTANPLIFGNCEIMPYIIHRVFSEYSWRSYYGKQDPRTGRRPSG